MSKTYCGADCTSCPYVRECAGCVKTGGNPFGKSCPLAMCSCRKGGEDCRQCEGKPCTLQEDLLQKINGLQVPDMPKADRLFALRGAFVNLEFTAPTGEKVKYLDDDAIYLGTQLHCPGNAERCFGIAADEDVVLICTYGCNGDAPELVLFRHWAE